MSSSKVLQVRTKRGLFDQPERRLIGPALAAVRESYLQNAELASMGTVFDLIGHGLDYVISEGRLDGLKEGDGYVTVAVADIAWRNRIWLCRYSVEELAVAVAVAIAELSTQVAAGVNVAQLVNGVFADWSLRASASIRRDRLPDADKEPLIGFASLLACRPDRLDYISRTADSEGAPVLIAALNSAGSARKRLRFRIGWALISIPDWALPTGRAAGSA